MDKKENLLANKDDRILSIMKKHIWNYDLSDKQMMKIWKSLFAIGNLCLDSYVKAKNNLKK